MIYTVIFAASIANGKPEDFDGNLCETDAALLIVIFVCICV